MYVRKHGSINLTIIMRITECFEDIDKKYTANQKETKKNQKMKKIIVPKCNSSK